MGMFHRRILVWFRCFVCVSVCVCVCMRVCLCLCSKIRDREPNSSIHFAICVVYTEFDASLVFCVRCNCVVREISLMLYIPEVRT